MTTLPVPFSGVEPAIDAIGADATVEQIAEARERLMYLIGFGVAMKRKFDEACAEYIKAHGPVHYKVNERGDELILALEHPKTTKCEDVKAAVEDLVKHSAGDWDAFVTCLSANALKHGACKKVLPPEVWARHFKVTVKDKLVDGSPAPKELQIIDTRWIK